MYCVKTIQVFLFYDAVKTNGTKLKYESKNWYVGKNKMKDWKACVRTWEQRQTTTKNINEKVPEWFNKELKNESMSEEDKQEVDNMLEDIESMIGGL